MSTRATLILKAGEKIAALAAYPGDFEQWIAAGLGAGTADVHTLDVRRHPALPAADGIGGVVVTGSAAMVTDGDPWIEATAAWLREAVTAGLPVLGICFGHQLLAHALGGRVDWNPAGVEVGSVDVASTPAAADDPLFRNLPSLFKANMSHRQSVLELPPGAVHLARSSLDPHAAFRWGPRAWGVQFHPEFDGAITRAHVAWYRGLLEERGDDVAALETACGDTPQARGLLARFASLTPA